VGGFKLIRGELEPLTAILLTVGFVSLLSICLYVRLKGSRIDRSGDKLFKHYSKKIRRLALRCCYFALALLMVLTGGGWYHWYNFHKHQIVVLVADFKSLQSKDQGVEEEIIRQLREALEEYDDVTVQALQEEITAQKGSKVARVKGKKHHADIVLWGWYQETNSHAKVTAQFEILEKLCCLPSVPTKPLIQPIAQLNSLEIQTQLSEEMSYLTLLTIGLVRYEAQDYEGAIARLTKALEFEPDAEQAIAQDTAIDALHFYRGLAYYEKKELEQAIADFTQALKINSEDAFAYYNRGVAYYKKGELDKAITDFTQALKINSEYAIAYDNRGVAYYKKGELDQAIADYNRALNIYPEDPVAYNNRGLAYYEKRELDQAIADFTQTLKINPEDAFVYSNRGNSYSDKGELDKAIADYNRALKINPKLTRSYIERGVAYYELGNKQKAIQNLKTAAKLFAEQGDTANQQQILELLKQLQQG